MLVVYDGHFHLISKLFIVELRQLDGLERHVVGRRVDAPAIVENEVDDGGIQDFVVDPISADAHTRERDVSDR